MIGAEDTRRHRVALALALALALEHGLEDDPAALVRRVVALHAMVLLHHLLVLVL